MSTLLLLPLYGETSVRDAYYTRVHIIRAILRNIHTYFAEWLTVQ